ncbi:MAG: sugar nucleotide-binding protein [Thaumarchaeota archaeon]|nr:sugar nucleotide-binding protein [Nitrososphaerota archaeon]
MKIAVTGASGLLGLAFVVQASRAHEIYSLYNKHVPSFGTRVRINLQSQNEIVKVMKEIRPDVIVHAAYRC